MICSPISWHLRGGLARVGAAMAQVLHLLRPHHRQRAGDGCSAEQRRARPWSCRSWTCSVAATSSIRWKISGKFQVERNYKFELIISGPLLGYLQSCSPCWPVSSCRPAALSSGLSHWQSLRSARESAGPTRIRCQSGLTASDRWLVVSRYKRT